MTALVAAEPLATWKVVAQLVAVPVLLVYCVVRKRNDLRIVALCVVSVTLYGMIQDQVCARMAPDYFLIAYPRVEGASGPTLLGLLWGFMGSWWVGLVLGLAAGLTATVGKRPQLTARELAPAVGCLLLGVAFVAVVCGGAAWYNGRVMGVRFDWAEGNAAERQLLLLPVACARFGAYAAALAGGVALCFWVAWRRRTKALNDASGRATS
jgi:hypothetical protein